MKMYVFGVVNDNVSGGDYQEIEIVCKRKEDGRVQNFSEGVI